MHPGPDELLAIVITMQAFPEHIRAAAGILLRTLGRLIAIGGL